MNLRPNADLNHYIIERDEIVSIEAKLICN